MDGVETCGDVCDGCDCQANASARAGRIASPGNKQDELVDSGDEIGMRLYGRASDDDENRPDGC